ncbi:hypothetical protein E34_1410 [Lactococcus lactis subsp. lactis]|uniref:Uncharacterized protein n=1 Tax=Lactococcus lactis subsp. lactis TaxID=1360 RepID=A0A0V8B0M0_LACLL|nr:hypothetical protein BSR25_1455 [Lactococcus lactis subsp. lactis bv. diacetylactis]KGF76900.1 hypothetical protein Llab_0907 [Lactococcus lactis]KST76612.1 hypothetical protein LK231_2165 [Lactococcus lactis subsp. lactis]CDI46408.1 hypothetical protein BN927_02530 [Lactococcus lactis subsp. lactis Dephy 1]KST77887.1 hypothetical protein E34_1410 [Lactococcus lactis subsp. lactis]
MALFLFLKVTDSFVSKKRISQKQEKCFSVIIKDKKTEVKNK